MQKKNHGQKRAKTFFFSVLFTAAVFPLVALMLAAILSATSDPGAHVGLFTLLAFLASGAVCGLCLPRFFAEKKFPFSLFSLGVFLLLLLLVSIAATGGKMPLSVPMNGLCYFLVGGLFSYLSARPKKKRRH